MVLVWRRLNEDLEARPAGEEALIVGFAVAIALSVIWLASGKHIGTALISGVVCGIGTGIGALISRPLRQRRRARRADRDR